MIELLRKRRSIRKYKPEKISQQHLKLIEEALLRSPSSRNKRPWEFILIENPEMIIKLSNAKAHGSEFLKGAPLAIIIGGDESLTDVWVEDCSIASIVAQLLGESLGIGSCWVQIRNRNHKDNLSSEKYIQELLDLPVNIRIESIIAMGYPAEDKQPVPASELPIHKIRKEKY